MRQAKKYKMLTSQRAKAQENKVKNKTKKMKECPKN